MHTDTTYIHTVKYDTFSIYCLVWYTDPGMGDHMFCFPSPGANICGSGPRSGPPDPCLPYLGQPRSWRSNTHVLELTAWRGAGSCGGHHNGAPHFVALDLWYLTKLGTNWKLFFAQAYRLSAYALKCKT